jgi:membrane protein implicated in regulation of membrane protease activity
MQIKNGGDIMEALMWIWLAVLALSIVIEIMTEQFVCIWFAPAALISLILNLLKAGPVWQIVVFVAITVVGIIFFRDMLLKKLNSSDQKTNIDAIIGEKCIVTERIDNFAGCGQAKVKGQIWSARGAHEDDVFETGEILTIVAIEGVKLICVKK